MHKPGHPPHAICRAKRHIRRYAMRKTIKPLQKHRYALKSNTLNINDRTLKHPAKAVWVDNTAPLVWDA